MFAYRISQKTHEASSFTAMTLQKQTSKPLSMNNNDFRFDPRNEVQKHQNESHGVGYHGWIVHTSNDMSILTSDRNFLKKERKKQDTRTTFLQP